MPGDVVVSYLHPHDVTYSFHSSLAQMVAYDQSRPVEEWRLARWLAVSCGTGGLIEARNKQARDFLELPEKPEWLLIVDTDMGFQPDALDRLLEVADPSDRPIVGGLCFAFKETVPDAYGGFRCEPRVTILDWVQMPGDEQPRFVGRAYYPVNSVVQCGATGAAFLLVHRRVLQRIRDQYGDRWFDRVPGTDGSLLGEDISFCLRAGALDLPVHVHTGVKTTHMKTIWVGEQDYWQRVPIPPAVEPTAVIVPVLHRPEHARPFMQSLRASTGLATCYAVCDDDDVEAIGAWRAQGAVIVPNTSGLTSYAGKVNVGYGATSEPWLFIAGSDVAFRAGWLDHAQHVANVQQASLIGTNDLGNPAVVAGEHATHFLVRRTYADEIGASWDGPGKVCHEGYRHWYVDNEIVLAAKQRGVWAMALGSVVEHLHPAWGKGDDDDVYRLGQSHAEADRKKFEWRLDRYGRVRAA